MCQAKLVKDENRNVLGVDKAVKTRWKNYFDQLMNTENERIAREATENEGEVREIMTVEVVEALKKMKKDETARPDDIPAEAWKCPGQTGVEKLRHLFNGILETEKIPDEWRWSTLVLIYKNKGNCELYSLFFFWQKQQTFIYSEKKSLSLSDTNMHIIQTCITMPGGMERRRMVTEIHITQKKARSRLHLPLPKKL